MPITDITTDRGDNSLTITARFDAAVDRVWELYADPRQLEQVWGPPTHPATFVDHDLADGAKVTYFMTGPDGDQYRGFWLITDVDRPHSFAFDDAFADENFDAVPALPVGHNTFSFVPDGNATIATYTTTYDSADDLDQVLDMGMQEGATVSINQIDEFLATN